MKILMKGFVNWMKEVGWFAIPLAVFGVLVVWLFGFYQNSYYHYKVRLTFCDSRPDRFVHHYGIRCAGIVNEGNGRYHAQTLSSFTYESADHSQHKVFNVCEAVIVEKEFIGDYTLHEVPEFINVGGKLYKPKTDAKSYFLGY
jgi:hypothetical protein